MQKGERPLAVNRMRTIEEFELRAIPQAELVVQPADLRIFPGDPLVRSDAVVVADAQPYAKLFDTGTMELRLTDDEVMGIGARMSAYSGAFAEAGPLAFVATTLTNEAFAKRFLNVSSVQRPAKLFRTLEQAKAWLATLPK